MDLGGDFVFGGGVPADDDPVDEALQECVGFDDSIWLREQLAGALQRPGKRHCAACGHQRTRRSHGFDFCGVGVDLRDLPLKLCQTRKKRGRRVPVRDHRHDIVDLSLRPRPAPGKRGDPILGGGAGEACPCLRQSLIENALNVGCEQHRRETGDQPRLDPRLTNARRRVARVIATAPTAKIVVALLDQPLAAIAADHQPGHQQGRSARRPHVSDSIDFVRRASHRVLRACPQGVGNDPKRRDHLCDRFLWRAVDCLYAGLRIDARLISTIACLAEIDAVAQNAFAACHVAPQCGLAPFATCRGRDRVAIQCLGDSARGVALRRLFENPADDGRVIRVDAPVKSDVGASFHVAIGKAMESVVGLKTLLETAACVFCHRLRITLCAPGAQHDRHRILLTLGHRMHLDPQMDELIIAGDRVAHASRKPVHRFENQHVELALIRGLEHRRKARSFACLPREFLVAEDLYNAPSLSGAEVAAHGLLIYEGGLFLELRRVADVDRGAFHASAFRFGRWSVFAGGATSWAFRATARASRVTRSLKAMLIWCSLPGVSFAAVRWVVMVSVLPGQSLEGVWDRLN